MRKLQQSEYAVLPCGRFNLRTGRAQKLAPLEDWTPGDSHLTVYADSHGPYRIVAGYGTGDRLPEMLTLAHDQTHRRVGGVHRRVMSVPNTREGVELMSERLGAACCTLCVLK